MFIDVAGFEPTSFPTKTVRRITNDASRQLGGATSCKLACNWDCLSSKSPGIIQWSDCLMLIAQSLSHWQGFAPCMVLFVRAPTTKPLPATQKPYLSYKRLPIPPQWHFKNSKLNRFRLFFLLQLFSRLLGYTPKKAEHYRATVMLLLAFLAWSGITANNFHLNIQHYLFSIAWNFNVMPDKLSYSCQFLSSFTYF